jgi:eukaryotic-like serine/threonine-protein kinase
MSLAPELTLNDRYQLIERIAVGGMGEVWRARDQLLDRDVAVKVLKEEYAADPTFLQRFRGEAKHTAALSHPGIANVFDYGEIGDFAYLVMELVASQPLSTVIARDAPIDPAVVLDMIGQAALALQSAHESGVVHRDVKPGNLLVRADGVVKVTDFGIARALDAAPVTQTGLLVGTAAYLSPEQAAGRAATAASDIYSLGVVGYECLTGARPFRGESAIGEAMAHVNMAPPPLPDSVPTVVADFVMRALDKDPAKRQPNAGDFGRTALAIAAELREPASAAAATAVGGIAATGPTDTKVMTAPPRPPAGDDDRQRRRIRNGFIATGAVVVLAGFVLLRSCTGGGVDTSRVPPVVGDTYTAAARALEDRGFDVKRVGVHRVHTAAGVVISQSVKRGTVLQAGSTVTLQVSTGPRTITIRAADYLGRPGDDVASELAAQHLTVRTLSLPSSAPAGTVIAIEPTGQVQEGATEMVTVATAQAPPAHIPPGHAKGPKGPKPDDHRGHGD